MRDEIGAGPSSYTDGHMPMTDENGASVPARVSEPDSIFGPFILDDTFGSSLTLTMPSTLAPVRIDACRHVYPRGVDIRRVTEGYVVRGLFDGPFPSRLTSWGTADGTAGSAG